jgi:hypothetical protein
LTPSRRIFGVTKISSSSLLLLRRRLEQVPSTGMSPSSGTFCSSLAALGLHDAAEDDRLAVVDEHLRDDLARVDRRHDAAGRARHELADAVLLDREVEDHAVVRRDLRLHLQRQHRLLELVVVAPELEDSWYGISTPCSIVASFWFAVMMRGVETISPRPRPARPRARGRRGSRRSAPSAIRPAGFATGRLTL